MLAASSHNRRRAPPGPKTRAGARGRPTRPERPASRERPREQVERVFGEMGDHERRSPAEHTTSLARRDDPVFSDFAKKPSAGDTSREPLAEQRTSRLGTPALRYVRLLEQEL